MIEVNYLFSTFIYIAIIDPIKVTANMVTRQTATQQSNITFEICEMSFNVEYLHMIMDQLQNCTFFMLLRGAFYVPTFPGS